MHFRFLFIFDPKKAGEEEMNSAIARDYALRQLSNDNTFCSGDGGGHFGSSIADWFVIGGRWSGRLQDAKVNNQWEKKLHEVCGHTCKDVYPENTLAKECFGFTDKEIKEHAKEIQKLWEDAGGTGKCQYLRDQYGEVGDEDDAMLITQEIYDKFLKEYEGQDEYTDNEHYVDWDYEYISTDIIGKKWIVMVDYHN